MVSRNRFKQEMREMQRDPDDTIKIVPATDDSIQSSFQISDEDSALTFKATIKGPKDSPFEGGTWKLIIKCPPDYPLH